MLHKKIKIFSNLCNNKTQTKILLGKLRVIIKHNIEKNIL